MTEDSSDGQFLSLQEGLSVRSLPEKQEWRNVLLYLYFLLEFEAERKGFGGWMSGISFCGGNKKERPTAIIYSSKAMKKR